MDFAIFYGNAVVVPLLLYSYLFYDMGEFMDFKMLCVRIIAICVISVLLTAVVKVLPRYRIPQWVYLAVFIVGIFLWVIAYAWEWWCGPDMFLIFALTMFLTTIRRLFTLLSYPGMPKIYFIYMARRLFWVSPLCLAFLFFEESGIIIFLGVVVFFILGYSDLFAMDRREWNPYEKGESEKVYDNFFVKLMFFSFGLLFLLYSFFVQYGSAINRWISQYFMVTP